MLNAQQVRVIDPILTNVAQGYIQPSFVGLSIFPAVPVEISGGQILQFGKEAFMQYNIRRAPGGVTKRIDFGYLGEKYALTNDSVECKLPFEWLRDAAVMPGIDLGTRAVKLGMNVVMLALEIEQASVALNAATYDNNHKITLAGTAKWSDNSSNPIADIDDYREAIRSSVGIYPNLLTLGPVAWKALRANPNVIDRFKYTNADSITEDMIARLFQIDKVQVGKTVQAADDGTMSDVWGNTALLSYSPTSVAGAEQPSFGYTYTMNGHPLVEVPYQDRTVKSWLYPTTYERAPVVAAPQAGFLIQTPA